MNISSHFLHPMLLVFIKVIDCVKSVLLFFLVFFTLYNCGVSVVLLTKQFICCDSFWQQWYTVMIDGWDLSGHADSQNAHTARVNDGRHHSRFF